MGNRTCCRTAILLALLVGSLAHAEVFVDDFNTPRDYVGQGVEGTIWDDFIGWMAGETVDALNASVDRPGELYMASTSGTWDSPWDPLSPFLFKVVQGDFIATVRIAGYAGTAASPVYHNDGGLMARAFSSDAGEGEDWISIDYFPIWNCGNFLWQADNDVRNEAWGCNNGKRWNLDPWLQLERSGNVFHARTSRDGVTWTAMPCSPKTRNDLAGLPLMVGLRQSTYMSDPGYVAFDDFRLEVIIKPKAHDPVPADKTANVAVSVVTWTPGDFAAMHDVFLGTSLDDVTNATTATAQIYKGRQASSTYSVDALDPGVTYYWRIDEVNDAHPDKAWKGDVWSFTPISVTAWNPSPADEATCVPADADLAWGAGAGSNRHDVYLGTDQALVAEATTATAAVYKGRQAGTTYDTGNLAKDTLYFWRIDEVQLSGGKVLASHKGEVWSFRTLPPISISDPHLVGWWKLEGDCANNDVVVDSSGYNRHGTVHGDPNWAPGVDGGALGFDGRGTYAELPIGDLIGSLTNSSFMTWANFSNSGGAWQRIFDFGKDPNVYMFLTPRIYFIDPMRFAIATDGAGNEIQVDDNAALPSGWHHVAVVIDASASTIILYLDGEEVERNAAATLTPKDLGTTTRNWLGRSQSEDDALYLGLLDDFRIYDQALTQGEIGRAMAGDPLLAWNPKPADGVLTDLLNVSPLTWSPGTGAVQHAVYLGTDANAVEQADRSDTTGIFRGLVDANSYSLPAALEWGQTYYWRVDEQDSGGAVNKGRVWTFATAEAATVDNFEAYNDACNRIYYAWKGGAGNSENTECGVGAYTGNGTGSTVGNDNPPYAERTAVHGGQQSMPFLYDNTAGSAVSEATRTLEGTQDWTVGGLKTLVLYFYGDPDNGPGQLYVKINNTRVNYDGSAEALTRAVWKQWNIDLTSLSGLQAVQSLTIGVSGSVKGKLLIDDIRIYRDAPAVPVPVDPGTTGLAAYYAFDGDVRDSAGTRNGTSVNDPTYTESRAGFGSAIQLDGVNDYVDLPIGSLIRTLTSATLAAWVHFDTASTGSWHRVFDFGNSSTTGYMFLTPSAGADGVLRFAISKTDGAATAESRLTSPLRNVSGWHHMAVVIDGAAGTLHLYLDGDQMATGPTATLPADLGQTTQNWLGRSQYESDPYYTGQLDEFRIYNRALSAGEVRYLVGDR